MPALPPAQNKPRRTPRCLRRGFVVGASALAALAASGCRSASPPARLEVFAASSLTDAFAALAAKFEARFRGHVALTFGGSQRLRLQIQQGAPADVFASADASHIAALTAAPPQVFAHNDLVIVTPRDDERVQGLGDLARVARIIVGTAASPIGTYTRRTLAHYGERVGATFNDDIQARIVSEEPNARLIRSKMELGAADAAVMYRTDARGSDRLRVVELPKEDAAAVQYLIVALAGSSQPVLQQRWVDLLRGDEGQKVLHSFGFGRP